MAAELCYVVLVGILITFPGICPGEGWVGFWWLVVDPASFRASLVFFGDLWLSGVSILL